MKKEITRWDYFKPHFEFEEILQDNISPWAGHKNFAYDLVRNLKPIKVVELGTHFGTSFFSFCQAAKDGKLGTQLIAVDTWRGDKHAGFYGEDVYWTVKKVKERYYSDQNITLLRKTFDEAANNIGEKTIDILHIDGLHTYEAVKHDFERWITKAKDDGVVLFHDIFIKEKDFGVYKLWEELKNEYGTVEFQLSFGLGVLFVDAEKRKELLELGREWQMKYSYTSESRKNSEIFNLSEKVRSKEKEAEKVITEKNQEIALMKDSKFWKMRNKYMKLKNKMGMK